MALKATETSTFYVPESLDWFLNFHVFATGRKKLEIIKEAIALYLISKGYKELERVPVLVARYETV